MTTRSLRGTRSRGRLSTEPILAWRAWALTGRRDGTDLLLRPVAGRSRPWRPHEPAEAACKQARLHAAPNIDCSCGLHGTHDADILRRTRMPAVLGRVALWGRVIEHELGYRAQYGYPQLSRSCASSASGSGGRPAIAPPSSAGSPAMSWSRSAGTTSGSPSATACNPADCSRPSEVDLRLRETYAVDALIW